MMVAELMVLVSKQNRRLHTAKRILLTAAVLLLPAMDVAAASEPAFITTDGVVKAMQARQLPVDGVHVDLAAHISATVELPVLEIQSAVLLNPHSARLRVGCQVHSECMAFYASAQWPATSQPISTAMLAASVGRPVPGAGGGAVKAVSALRPGSHAVLLIDQDRIHIRLPVICVQGGAAGDKVKVTTANRQQLFEAVILNNEELKGTL